MLPIGLCALWFSLRNPAVSMLGMLVLNYFIMYLGREFLHGVPVGLTSTARCSSTWRYSCCRPSSTGSSGDAPARD